jgi:cobaltochelatase CobN
MNTIEYTFGWDVTSDAVDDWEYQACAEHFLFNEENLQWIEENNPYAFHNMAGQLLEALSEGFGTPMMRQYENYRKFTLRQKTILRELERISMSEHAVNY